MGERDVGVSAGGKGGTAEGERGGGGVRGRVTVWALAREEREVTGAIGTRIDEVGGGGIGV